MPTLPRALLVAVAVAAPAAAAEPMDVSDPRPRWVSVRFEVSPREQPGRLDATYGDALPAWLEPGEAAGEVQVRVPAALVERHLLADQNPVAGSFSDFVWVFDTRTGHVTTAQLHGTLRQPLSVGPFAAQAETEIRVRLSTRAQAGFEPPRRVLGQLLHRHCRRPDDDRCSLVPAAPYDPESGYVNAVGVISVRAGGVETSSFCPLGEARFAERSQR